MFNYKTYYDLSRDIAAGVQRLSGFDMVVGIPRSGIIPGMMISAFLNVPNFDLDTFIFINTPRSGSRKLRGNSDSKRKSRVLIVDDSVNTGTEMRRVRTRLEPLASQFDFIYCAIYAVDASNLPVEVDVALASLPHPRVFQWNYRSHIIAEHACFDMDGVLCVDPVDGDNDDGPRYIEFIKTAEPLFIPKKKISAIVTSRLEKYRAQTTDWLARNGVKYGELIMLDMPSAEARRKARAHAPFKAEVFGKRPEIVFVESNWKQAMQIAELADKPIICTENDICLLGKDHLDIQSRSGELFLPESLHTQEFLRREVARLSVALGDQASGGVGISFDNAPATKNIDRIQIASRSHWVDARLASSVSSFATNQTTAKNVALATKIISSKAKPMRVAMICYTLDKKIGAGAAESSNRLCAALRKIGVEVEVITRETFGDFVVDFKEQPRSGVKIGFWNSYHHQSHSEKLRRRLEEIAPDIVVLGAIDRGIISLADISALPYPIVWINRDNWSHTGGCLFQLGDTKVLSSHRVSEAAFSAMSCRGYVNSCTECLAIEKVEERGIASAQHQMKKIAYSGRPDLTFAPISPWLARTMSEASLTKGKRITQIFNPIDLTVYKPLDTPRTKLRRELGLPVEGRLVLLAAHRVGNPRKGADLLMKAIEDGMFSSDIRFVVIGQQTNDIFPVAVAQRFISLGYIDDDALKVKLYNAVDATAVPALQESLSVVASDSLCCGTPVIAFGTSGLNDFLSHKETAYLAAPFDVEDFAHGVEWVCLPENAAKLSSAAAAAAARYFDETKNARAYEQLFVETIANFEQRNGGVGVQRDPTVLVSHPAYANDGLAKRVEKTSAVFATASRVSIEMKASNLAKPVMKVSLADANRLMREGRYEEAYSFYEKLFEAHPLQIYQANMELLRGYLKRGADKIAETRRHI